jgi:Uma2 family endonuclease
MASPAPRRMSLAEFLEWDDGTDARYELIDGEVVAMAPPMHAHAIIVANLARGIGAALQPPCIVLAGAGVVGSTHADRYFVPDLVVTCAAIDPRGRYLSEPRLIVEILSPATTPRDRVIKLDDYRALRSVEELLLVWAVERRVQLWRRAETRWIVEDMIGDAGVQLASIGASIPLATIYEHVAIGDPSEASGHA